MDWKYGALSLSLPSILNGGLGGDYFSFLLHDCHLLIPAASVSQWPWSSSVNGDDGGGSRYIIPQFNSSPCAHAIFTRNRKTQPMVVHQQQHKRKIHSQSTDYSLKALYTMTFHLLCTEFIVLSLIGGEF